MEKLSHIEILNRLENDHLIKDQNGIYYKMIGTRIMQSEDQIAWSVATLDFNKSYYDYKSR